MEAELMSNFRYSLLASVDRHRMRDLIGSVPGIHDSANRLSNLML